MISVIVGNESKVLDLGLAFILANKGFGKKSKNKIEIDNKGNYYASQETFEYWNDIANDLTEIQELELKAFKNDIDDEKIESALVDGEIFGKGNPKKIAEIQLANMRGLVNGL